MAIAKAEITLSRIVDIASVTRYYKLQSSTASAPAKPTANPPSGWVTAEPSYTSGSTNTLYFVDQTIFTNGTFSYSAVSKSSSYEAAKEAYNKAQAAGDAASDANNKIDNLEVGGRNLILDSMVEETSNAYGFGSRILSEILKPNTTYTLTVNGRTNDDKTTEDDKYLIADIYCSDWSFYKSVTIKERSDTTKSVTFTTPSDNSDIANGNVIVATYYYPSQATSGVAPAGTCTINWYKLEKGNKATDWTPAPEDVQEGIDSAQGTADAAVGAGQSNAEQISKVSSELQILKDNITSMVSSDKGGSVITQTDEGWVLNMGDTLSRLDKIEGNITDVNGDIQGIDQVITGLQNTSNSLIDKTAHIVMKTDDNGDPYIELGKEDEPFKVRITNKSIDFMEGSQKIAYITNHSLYIQSSVVTDELQIGESPGWVWKKRANNNLGLRWKP